MSAAVTAGQVMVLTNLKSRQDAICRVVKVRAFAKAQSYVEIEFTSPQPGYWGVYFPSDGPEVARAAALPSPQATESASVTAPVPQPPAAPAPGWPAQYAVAPASSAVERKIPEISRPAAPAPLSPPASVAVETAAHAEVPQPPVLASRPLSPPKLPESSFVSIGVKEDVLAPADSTRAPRPISSSSGAVRSEQDADNEIGRAIDALIAPSTRPGPSTPASSRVDAVESTRGLRPAQLVTRTETSAKPPAVQNATAETSLPAPKQMFGVTLDSASSVSFQVSRSSGRAWIPLGIAAMLVAGAAGAYYLRVGPFAGAAARGTPAAVSPAVAQSAVSQPVAPESSPMPGTTGQAPDSSAPTVPSDVAPGVTATANAQKEPGAPEIPSISGDLNPYTPRPAASARDAASKQPALAGPQPKGTMPSTFGVLNSRPIVRTILGENSPGAAPTLGASGSPSISSGSLPALAPPAPNLPAPPKPAPTAPVRVGGKILPPRLVSSVLPVYPPIAQQAGVSGTVVIDTTIDKNGNVSKTRVISGPELLRSAALSALRQLKYEPSKLNGEPISVEMIVSIQFH